jgi:metal-responsive CopG/Arc/MetJ family transcriptional regulator
MRIMKASTLHQLPERSHQSLRLDYEMLEAIDRLRARRPGNISRNTWIVEAVQEKIERELQGQNRRRSGGRHA